MNSVQRRLFRAFADAGGDLTEDVEVERFIRYVDATLILLPPRVREATELMWRSQDGMAYSLLVTQLAQRAGTAVTVTSLRQRVSRGVRELEASVRQRSWGAVEGGPSAQESRPGPLRSRPKTVAVG